MKNKMGDTQKMAFLNAMRQSEPSKKEEIEKAKEDTTIFHDTAEEIKRQPRTVFKTRAERRAASEGYTRPVAPLPVDEEAQQPAQPRRKETVIRRQTLMTEETEQRTRVKKTPFNVTVDDLYDALAEVQDYQSKDYTKETWLPFVSAFTQALEVYQMDDPSAEKLMVASEALRQAKNQLESR